MKKRLLSLLLAVIMVIGATPVYALTAFADETNEVQANTKNSETNYDSLYVGYKDGTFEKTSLILDFFSATPDSAALTGSASYTNTTKNAGSRFNGAASNYVPYTVFAADGVDISGGTAAITSPWKFNNYYREGYWPFEGGTAQSGNNATADMVDARETPVTGVTDYYISDGNHGKVTYASKWQDGSLNLGQYSTLSLASAIGNALGDDKSYTVQFVANREAEKNSDWTAFVGVRLSVVESSADVQFSAGSNSYHGEVTAATTAGDMDAVNTYTVAIDKAAAENNFAIYLNNALATKQTIEYKTADGTLKLFEGANSSVYAIRVYDYVLSADEIAQNNFADIAKYYNLDITAFIDADATAKKAVYAAFAAKTLDTITATEAQTLLDNTLASAAQ